MPQIFIAELVYTFLSALPPPFALNLPYNHNIGEKEPQSDRELPKEKNKSNIYH